MAKVLFQNKDLTLDVIKYDGRDVFRVSLFNDENHWSGEIVFDKERVIYDDLTEEN